MEPTRTVRTEPRHRGVLLRELDRSQLYVIGFVGRRWETIGPLERRLIAPDSGLRAEGGAAPAERASTPPHADAPDA